MIAPCRSFSIRAFPSQQTEADKLKTNIDGSSLFLAAENHLDAFKLGRLYEQAKALGVLPGPMGYATDANNAVQLEIPATIAVNLLIHL